MIGMKILITGPQGSGKTTQAKILAKKMGLCLVGAGDLIRDYAQNQPDQASKLQQELSEGKLVDDNVVYQLVKDRLNRPDCKLGFISDGYPRSQTQSALFDPEFDIVFYLDISDQEAKNRLLLRNRADDTPKQIDSRLYWYHHETEPLVQHYKKQGKLIKIDANQSVEVIAAQIEDQINKFS